MFGSDNLEEKYRLFETFAGANNLKALGESHTKNLNQTVKLIKAEWDTARKSINKSLEALAGSEQKLTKALEDRMKDPKKAEGLKYSDHPALLNYQVEAYNALLKFVDATFTGFVKFRAELYKELVEKHPAYSHCLGIFVVFGQVKVIYEYFKRIVLEGQDAVFSATDLVLVFNNKLNVGIASALTEAVPANREFVEKRVGPNVADILDRVARNEIRNYKKVIDKQIGEIMRKGLPRDIENWGQSA